MLVLNSYSKGQDTFTLNISIKPLKPFKKCSVVVGWSTVSLALRQAEQELKLQYRKWGYWLQEYWILRYSILENVRIFQFLKFWLSILNF